MPVLPNPRWEHFSHLVAMGESATRAYISAGFSEKGAKVSASRLLARANVAARVAEIVANLSAKTVEKTAYTKATAMEEADKALLLAMKKENPGAAVAAITLRAKLSGLLVDKKEIRTGALDELSPEERDAAINAIRRELEGRASGASTDRGAKPPGAIPSVH